MQRPPKGAAAKTPVPDLSSITAAAAQVAVGYNPPQTLKPSDEALFKAFQANLLSLISHELRTPLMGVLNPLGVLDSGASGGMSEKDLIAMAYRNAQHLHQTLTTLLDLASIESGSFHARFREVDLLRVVRARWDAQSRVAELRDSGIHFEVVSTEPDSLTLADPQKIDRAFDLCFLIVASRAEKHSQVQVRVTRGRVDFSFNLALGGEKDWESDWTQGAAAFEGGLGSPSSLFGGVVQSEQAFLTRMREGLGSEFLLVHQILRLHSGKFQHERSGDRVVLSLCFPDFPPEEGLRSVLISRAYVVSHELGSVALALVEVPPGEDSQEFRTKIAANLFRATDAVYALPGRRQVALIMDDCKPGDAEGVVLRIERSPEMNGAKLKFSVAHCPGDGMDPGLLVELAERRLKAGR